MSQGLASHLRDVEIQRQLIASGSLDAQAGRATRRELREAIQWFRRAYRFKDNLEPLTTEEREKLKEVQRKFEKRTDLQRISHKDPGTGNELWLRLPVALVGRTYAKNLGEHASEWSEYRAPDNSVSVGPELQPLSRYTPISLFRERILSVPLKYKHLHLTSEEFAAHGENDKDDFFSHNLVLTHRDQLKGVFMRYARRPPAGFEVPDFLLPMVAAEARPTGTAKPDATTRGWQLMMQGITNLVAGEFPFDNGWTAVSTKTCPLTKDSDTADAQPKAIRILFGTDRKMKPAANTTGRVADPDALFSNEMGNQLHLGCAYVSVPAVKDAAARDFSKSAITDYRTIHSTKKADFGDLLHMFDEIAESRESASALVFVHGYNTSFRDALFTVAQIVSATDYPGRVYLYSWPSAQSTLGYIADLDNAEQAEPFLQHFMKLLMRDADIDEIDILAHSMGSQSVLRTVSALRGVLETQRQGRTGARSMRIGQIIFAAPDVAMPVFDQKIRRIAPYADRVTVYASAADAALSVSRWLRSGATARTGALSDNGEPLRVEIKNVHVIDATRTASWWRPDQKLFGFGHDYFKQSPGVLRDIQEILKATGKSERLTPKQRSKARFIEVPFKDNGEDWVYWKLTQE